MNPITIDSPYRTDLSSTALRHFKFHLLIFTSLDLVGVLYDDIGNVYTQGLLSLSILVHRIL